MYLFYSAAICTELRHSDLISQTVFKCCRWERDSWNKPLGRRYGARPGCLVTGCQKGDMVRKIVASTDIKRSHFDFMFGAILTLTFNVAML
jgi:hypothetical protein